MGKVADFELLEAWRGGDQSAGDALVRRHYDAVLRFFQARTQAADDLTQRTFLGCVEGRERFRGDASFRAFLFGIARRQLAKHIHDLERTGRLADLSESPSPKTSVSRVVARRQEHRLLLSAMADLPEPVYTVLVLYYWEGLRAREIGEVLDVPASTITTRLSRARKHLADACEALTGEGRRDALIRDIDDWMKSMGDPNALSPRSPVRPMLARRNQP